MVLTLMSFLPSTVAIVLQSLPSAVNSSNSSPNLNSIFVLLKLVIVSVRGKKVSNILNFIILHFT